jgi:hypothetical protein
VTDKDAYILIGAGAGLAFVVWKWGNPVTAAQIAEQWAVNLIGRGNALSYGTLDSNGVIDEIPSVLNDQASAVLGFGSDQDTYSLARMGRSEGVDGMEYRMHVALNDMADLLSQGLTAYSTITNLMTYSKVASANGHYSKQSLGKRYSTAHDPYEGDYALAQKVLSDNASGVDPTGGAIKFIDKSGPLYVNGTQVDYDTFVANWATEGLTPSTLPGATDNFVVFSRGA